jgi:hypothetical protein
MEIQPATPAMFDGIHQVLREFGGELSEQDWRRLLEYRFGDRSHRGWVSIKDGEIIGYLGAIFSQRHGGRFCDLTSWIVKAKHRKGSLHLLQPMLELEDHTLLNFSPSPFTLAVFKRLGFEVLEETLLLIPPLSPRLAPRGCEVVRGAAEISRLLKPSDRQIYDDHQPYEVNHIVVRGPEGYCYLVVSKTRLRRWPVSFIHYVSNPELLASAINVVQRELLRLHRTVLTVVDSRLVEGHPLRGARRYALAQPRLYKPAPSLPVAPRLIDSLYTEFVVLNPRRWTFNY